MDENNENIEGRRVQKRHSAADRERLRKKFRASKLSRQEFCEEESLNLATFHGWLKEEKTGGRFTKMEVPLPVQAPVEIELANGVRIRLRPRDKIEELAGLIRELTGGAA